MNLYLSRLLLNQRSRQVISERTYPYERHRTLMRGFGEPTDEKKRKQRDEFGVLYRADIDSPGCVKVYVQSRIEPEWSFLDNLHGYLYLEREGAAYEHKDIMPVCGSIRNGKVFAFRLRANPTKRVGNRDDQMKGKRVGLVRENEQLDWLVRRGIFGGFELLTNRVEDAEGETMLVPRVNVCFEGRQTGYKRDASGDRVMTHLTVLFDGYLRVTDANAFLDTVARGIGPAKAFGCGLLSLARA